MHKYNIIWTQIFKIINCLIISYIYYPRPKKVHEMPCNVGCHLVKSEKGKHATWIHQLPKKPVQHIISCLINPVFINKH